MCDLAGDLEFPYGYDPHCILGLRVAEIRDDTWYFLVDVSVLNEFNAERDVTFECVVGGTEQSPEFVSGAYI